MSNAMRNRLTAAKSGAGESVKAKTTAAPLVEPTADLRLVPTTEASITVLEPTAVAEATGVLTNNADAPLVLPKITRPGEPDATVQTTPAPGAPIDEAAPVMKRRALKGAELVELLTAPPAAMGTAGESKLLTIPVSEEVYGLLQQLDRDLALSTGRPINRQRLVSTAVETALGNPQKYAKRYLQDYNAGTTWKRRVQARIPLNLAAQLPHLRYTGSSRQSAGMLVSIAVAELLRQAASVQNNEVGTS